PSRVDPWFGPPPCVGGQQPGATVIGAVPAFGGAGDDQPCQVGSGKDRAAWLDGGQGQLFQQPSVGRVAGDRAAAPARIPEPALIVGHGPVGELIGAAQVQKDPCLGQGPALLIKVLRPDDLGGG